MKPYKQYREEFKRLGYNEKNLTKSFYENFSICQKRKQEIEDEIKKLREENNQNHIDLIQSDTFYKKYPVMYRRFLEMYESDDRF